MALVPCRECGKEVSDAAEACPYCGIKTPSKKRRQIKLAVTALIILLLIGGSVWAYHRVVRAFSPPETTVDANGKTVSTTPAVPKLKPTVSVKEQVLQKDHKEIVREMLDSGQSVREISKKTGMRLDEVRKIKKEKKQDEKAQGQ